MIGCLLPGSRAGQEPQASRSQGRRLLRRGKLFLAAVRAVLRGAGVERAGQWHPLDAHHGGHGVVVALEPIQRTVVPA